MSRTGLTCKTKYLYSGFLQKLTKSLGKKFLDRPVGITAGKES